MAFHIETETFNRAAEKIARIEPCPFAGKVTADQVKLALGEFMDVWPASIADGVHKECVQLFRDGSLMKAR